jgi:hypothetical protein
LLIVLGQILVLSDPAEFWRLQLAPLADEFVEAGLFDLTQREAVLAQLSQVMCGVIAAAFVLQLLLSLYLARWWQALIYNPGGFSAEFQQLRNHKGLGLLGVLAMGMSLIPESGFSGIVNCLGAVVLTVFLLQGLAVAHGVFGRMQNPVPWLVAIYLLLLVFMPQMVVVLVTVGLLDVWLDFRNRYPNRRDGE